MYNKGKVLSKFTGHKKKVNDVIFHPQFSTSSLVLSASADCSVKVWKAVTLADKPGKSTALWTYTDTSEVNGVMVHPSGLFAISYTAAGSWTFLDIDTEAVLKRATSPFT
jgi:WD40 repeat protein